jgi:hypothetical protein
MDDMYAWLSVKEAKEAKASWPRLLVEWHSALVV